MERSSCKNKKFRMMLVLTSVFFIGMVILSVFSRSIHESGLAHVTTGCLEVKYFPFVYINDKGEEQEGLMSSPAIKETDMDKPIYVADHIKKNGEDRIIAKKVDPDYGDIYNGYVRVVGGLSERDELILYTDSPISDGDEIIIEK